MSRRKEYIDRKGYYFIKPVLDTKIFDFPRIDPRVEALDYKLSLCGQFATKNFYCEKSGVEHLLKSTHSPFFCEIRYCSRPECLVQRFKRQLQTFQDIQRFHGLKKLWHFAIGFEPVSEIEFKKNFTKYKKRFEYVLNRYFGNLRKKGVNPQAVRVLDFSFKTEGMVYLHYHFGAIPLPGNRISPSLKLMQETRIRMISRMKIKTNFHLQSFGLASKTGVLSYLSIRASGMYKYDMIKNPRYKHLKIGNLKESIKLEKYLFLNQILTKEEYLQSFYNKSHFLTIGGLPRPPPHGSNITDTMPLFCEQHGALERSDIRIEVLFDQNILKPPSPSVNYSKIEKIDVEIIKIY